ncbi:MAG: PIG-L family deacetylase [Nitriliruptoraceae bacterium]
MAFTLMCVHPHPDDETLACGGVLALAAAAGHRTVVVTCTGGEEGENLGGVPLDGQTLSHVRREELDAALAVLSVTAHHWLGYRDSGMAGTAANSHPDAFASASTGDAARLLAELIRRERPDVIVSDNADGTYGHPDHVKAFTVTREACVLAADAQAPIEAEPWDIPKRYVHTISYSRIATLSQALEARGLASPFPASNVAIGTDDARITTRVDVAGVRKLKRAALACHASQVGPDSFFFNVPEPYASLLFDVEEFRLLDAANQSGEQDLFGGLGT